MDVDHANVPYVQVHKFDQKDICSLLFGCTSKTISNNQSQFFPGIEGERMISCSKLDYQ